jgi:hypothetical protein
LRQGWPRRGNRRQKGERHHTRPEEAADPHAIAFECALSGCHLSGINLYGG